MCFVVIFEDGLEMIPVRVAHEPSHLAYLELYREEILQQKEETDAMRAIAAMQQGSVLPLDEALALSAARLSLQAKLPMADSIMLAAARATGSVLWTQDKDFEGMEGVRCTEPSKYRPGA